MVPFHRWLPGTVDGPTPVSALLHAGVVNGVAVLALRFAPTVMDSRPAVLLLFALGVATAVWATGVMMTRPDVKGRLAWSTAGQMGFMAVQVAIGAWVAAVVHLVGHAMYKAVLFLGAGGTVATASAASRRSAPAPPSPLHRMAAGAVAALAIGAALLTVGRDLGGAKLVLVAVFAWFTLQRLAAGWIAAAPNRVSVLVGWVTVFGLAFAYTGGIVGAELVLGDHAPAIGSSAVGPTLLIATIAVLAVAGALLATRPAAPLERLYDLATDLLSDAGQPVAPARSRPLVPVPIPPESWTVAGSGSTAVGGR
jgi:NADH:ubiquinone oxidoreductase subunit 5 (subunit L)/multisubunit Na+/H+ antiporter MnhA subunit